MNKAEMSQKQIRICMLSYSFYENDGRVKRYAEALTERGEQVDVIALKRAGQPFFEIHKGVNVYRIQERTLIEKGKFSYLQRIIRFLVFSSFFLSKRHLRNPYDIVHIHSIPDFEVFAAFLPKLYGAKLILDIHDIVPELYVSKFGSSKNSSLFRALVAIEKLSCLFADHVIISNHIWEEKLLSRSVTRNKCSTFLNYPDPSIFYPRPRVRNDNKFIMSYPGTLNWHQGVDLVIKAFEIMAPKVPEAEFHIYGLGSELGKLKEMAITKRLENKIQFKSPIPIEKIAELMANVDLGIIPKRNGLFGGEAFSTKSLEFMALGVPLVISRTKIDKYYFNDSIVKFFEPENVESLAGAMLEMIKNEDLRKRLSESALKFVEDFSWRNKKQEYFNLVDSLTTKLNSRLAD
jgi:glycosyltransferase involved in cell wall biosynthesis